MDSEPQPLAVPYAGREDNQAVPRGAAHTEGRSTDRPTHTPRDARNGDHQSRPGALPPAPGRLSRVLGRPAVPVLLAVVLVVVSWQVAVDGPLLGLDRWARSAVRETRHELHSALLNHLGKALSDLGGGAVAVPVLFLGGAVAAWRDRLAGVSRWWLPGAVAVLTAGLIPLLVVPAKAWFARPGPFGLPLAADQWGWYPSGHTATATLAYGVAALLLARTAGPRSRRRLAEGAALLSAGVGLGLVWSDYHWLLDVVASWCLGGLVLLALARWLPARRRPGGPGSPTGR
ncbi:phosphatase PAP2 family protein [Kitasatospora sp. NPDC058406]|uniref:phosphatase PAP2 family protein n=1 Tax=Kitasatospora sp. NPDC058406 TaxID=3346483 RepID=UPI0036486243